MYPLGCILWNITLPERRILKINSLSVSLPWRTIQKWIIMILQNYIMSVLGLNSVYTVKYNLRFQEFPWIFAFWNFLRQMATYIWPYILCLILICIQYNPLHYLRPNIYLYQSTVFFLFTGFTLQPFIYSSVIGESWRKPVSYAILTSSCNYL